MPSLESDLRRGCVFFDSCSTPAFKFKFVCSQSTASTGPSVYSDERRATLLYPESLPLSAMDSPPPYPGVSDEAQLTHAAEEQVQAVRAVSLPVFNYVQTMSD